MACAVLVIHTDPDLLQRTGQQTYGKGDRAPVLLAQVEIEDCWGSWPDPRAEGAGVAAAMSNTPSRQRQHAPHLRCGQKARTKDLGKAAGAGHTIDKR